ncbi:hypothetical protein IPH19_01660 [Candidatus Uhrbacteria bacterium]|jgi:hypothetical protein|nr:MAG: hypothetical protein IPH19_01660 [Candidatus Uhrbacteria bacterium]
MNLVARLFGIKEKRHIDRYHILTVTHPEELELADELPLELRFVLSRKPERRAMFAELLLRGFGIAIRTVDRTPEAVLKAVDNISRNSQHNTIIPWLPNLLREGKLPVFSEPDLVNAEKQGVNLNADALLIMERRFEFKKIVLVDLHNGGVGADERAFMRELNEDLYPFAIDYIVNRVVFDNAHTRTEVAQSIIKALLIVGPIAHGLEHYASGIGKLFAASADDILAETAELFALHGSGFSWKELAKRGWVLVPVFCLATWGVLSVDTLIEQGRIALAGAVFGFSAVALSLTTAIQSIGMYHQAYRKQQMENKLPLEKRGLWKLALVQDFSNPARLGLFLGAFMAPIAAATVFVGFPEIVHNGWVLALLGSVESIIAGLTVIAAVSLNRFMFRRSISQKMA